MIYVYGLPFVFISLILYLFDVNPMELKFWSLSVLLTILYCNLIFDYEGDDSNNDWNE